MILTFQILPGSCKLSADHHATKKYVGRNNHRPQGFLTRFLHTSYGAIEMFKSTHKQVIRVKKNSCGWCPPHSNYLGVFFRFITTFAEVITFVEALAHEFKPNF